MAAERLDLLPDLGHIQYIFLPVLNQRLNCRDVIKGLGTNIFKNDLAAEQLDCEQWNVFFFFRSKLGLFQSRISLQKASVKVSPTLARITKQPLHPVVRKPKAILWFLEPYNKSAVLRSWRLFYVTLIHHCIFVFLSF